MIDTSPAALRLAPEGRHGTYLGKCSLKWPYATRLLRYAMVLNRIFLSIDTGEVRVNYGQNTDELWVKVIGNGGEK
jgi:hypothetical protein